jgi:hypothetical protein
MQQKEVRRIALISIGSLLAVLTAVLINIATSQNSPLAHLPLPLVWFLIGLLTVIGVLVAVYDRLQPNATTSDHPVAKREQENRQRLLARVRATWIKGVLDQSLYSEARIALGFQEQPDALADPWHLSVLQLDQPERPLPAGTRIIQIFDNAQGELLILGEPGSGKTTLLLELTRTLLTRTTRDNTPSMPVVFNLSSWATKRQPLIEWFIEELYMKYQVPRPIGQLWVYNDQILPLLDGLDEVVETHRAACIDAINVYRRDHGSVPTVVCSRRSDYFSQEARLQLQSAVVIQSLTEQQVDTYLGVAGEQLTALRKALREDTVLRELITTPLMLSILILTYRGQTIEEGILTGSLETRRQHIFKTYVQRMLNRHSAETNYTEQQTLRWLQWLAKQLIHHNQSEFYLEELQPDWLTRVWMFRLSSILLLCLLSGLIFGLFFGLLVGLLNKQFSLGLFWLAQRLSFDPLIGLAHRLYFDPLLSGLLSGLFFGLFFGLATARRTHIYPAEVVTWSWARLRQKLLGILVIGLLYGLLGGLLLGLFLGLFLGLLSGLFFGLLGVLFLGINRGLSNDRLEKIYHLIPNQGILRSARNGILYGLLVGLLGGLSFGLLGGLLLGLLYGLLYGLFVGLFLGLFFGLFAGGGLAYIQHIILRLLLWQSKLAPLRYVRFLDYTTRCILLRKIGGGYIFIHRLLLDFLAS